MGASYTLDQMEIWGESAHASLDIDHEKQPNTQMTKKKPFPNLSLISSAPPAILSLALLRIEVNDYITMCVIFTYKMKTISQKN